MRSLRFALIVAMCGCGDSSTSPVDATTVDGSVGNDAQTDAATPPLGDRDRLLATYLAYLEQDPTTPQSNGLRGADLDDVCDLWTALDPSSRATFLTITARLAGSHLADGSSMLAHVTALYRVTGGDGATPTDPGSCGGGEYNRLMMSMAPPLQAALLAANTNQGAPGPGGGYDLADIPAGGFWRESQDAGGAHAPFDTSDETEGGAPRGQVQYFQDPTSAIASAPLGRLDLATLVDPYALEMDHDFDCFHNSNPSCDYTLYGPLCAPMASASGTDLYTATYGDFEPAWRPAGCP